jgi:uncharacterized small protein (DUF1192 family)
MEDDDKAVKITSPLGALLMEDLEPQSVEDLERRVLKLNQEILRAEKVIQAKKSVRGAAQSIFKS